MKFFELIVANQKRVKLHFTIWISKEDLSETLNDFSL